jgi:hypothetical protein
VGRCSCSKMIYPDAPEFQLLLIAKPRHGSLSTTNSIESIGSPKPQPAVDDEGFL